MALSGHIRHGLCFLKVVGRGDVGQISATDKFKDTPFEPFSFSLCIVCRPRNNTKEMLSRHRQFLPSAVIEDVIAPNWATSQTRQICLELQWWISSYH